MNVRQLIAILEKVENKERLVYVKDGDKSGGCCNSGDFDWDECSAVDEVMVEQYAYSIEDKGMQKKNVYVVKLDTY